MGGELLIYAFESTTAQYKHFIAMEKILETVKAAMKADISVCTSFVFLPYIIRTKPVKLNRVPIFVNM